MTVCHSGRPIDPTSTYETMGDATGLRILSLRVVTAVSILVVTCPIALCQDLKDAANRHEKDSLKRQDFPDEPGARGILDAMNEAIRSAQTLSFTSQFEREAVGRAKTACTYRIWLKKPNFFRMETETLSGEKGGVLVGDGSTLWIYWPNGRPRWDNVPESDEDESTRFNSYMSKPARQGQHSIWHEAVFLGGGMSLPILEASKFHGYVDSIEAHFDGARGIGTRTIDGERCDGIEVSYLGQQRVFRFWVSQRDHLPRRLSEVVQLSYKNIARESWSTIKINEQIPNSMFRWEPPDDWEPWFLPNAEEGLLKAGVEAPEFDLAAIDGTRIRLSDYRGSTVWLCFWRLGCPPCRKETPFLQDLHVRLKNRGLVVLGVNVSDDRDMTMEYLDDQGVTFPNILDTSDEAADICENVYSGGGVPTNYIIDSEGRVIDAWIGHSEDRAKAALGRVGLQLAERAP